MAITIRELDKRTDRKGVEAIETAFTTATVFDMVASPRKIELVERTLETPLTKRFSIKEVFAQWAEWDHGWVADEDGVRGFATCEYQPWHQRLLLWFLYISPEYRRRGIGRALLAKVEEHGRSVGATHVWLETSNVNVPGVAAYEHCGYSLQGVDSLYYGRYAPGETAIYLAKRL